MISSLNFNRENADGDHQIKRMKTNELAEEFFFQAHPFSDLVLLVQDREIHVDKSVLAVGSKVFQTYFQDENLDSIEILDVTPNEMIQLLQFLYPQFQCTITNQNVTILLILAHRFELHFLASACRSFILFYLSKLKFINVSNGEFIEQEDGTRLSIHSILENLCLWLREFSFNDDQSACEILLNQLSQCRIGRIHALDFDEKIKWKIFQARAKYLEQQIQSN